MSNSGKFREEIEFNSLFIISKYNGKLFIIRMLGILFFMCIFSCY